MLSSSLDAQRTKAGLAPLTTRTDTRGNVVTLQGKQTPRSAAYKSTQQAQSMSPSGTPESAFGTDTSSFADDIMGLIGQMPAGSKRDQYLSAFQQIKSLPASEQQQYLQSLQQEAQEFTQPQYQQDLSRLNEQFGYAQGQNTQNIQFANDTYHRLSQNLDTNALRQKSQDNKVLADALSRVTSDAFVTNVAGSGIVARRAQMERYSAQQTADNQDIANAQSKAASQESLDQYVARQTGSLDRSQQQQAEGQQDLAQQNKYDTNSLFLDLFGNETKDTQNQLMKNISPSDTFQTTGQVTQKSAPSSGTDRIALRRQVRLAQQGQGQFPARTTP